MAEANERLPITPDSKVGPLLVAYPQLEQVLIDISPTYRALKNPLLRKTVAKVATLRQVAKVGGVAVGTLVNRLRAAAGLPTAAVLDTQPAAGERPDWAQVDRARQRFDARDLIEGGGHPLERVSGDLGQLAATDVYLLITPFVPAPLIELFEKKGFRAHSEWFGPEVVRTFFMRG